MYRRRPNAMGGFSSDSSAFHANLLALLRPAQPINRDAPVSPANAAGIALFAATQEPLAVSGAIHPQIPHPHRRNSQGGSRNCVDTAATSSILMTTPTASTGAWHPVCQVAKGPGRGFHSAAGPFCYDARQKRSSTLIPKISSTEAYNAHTHPPFNPRPSPYSPQSPKPRRSSASIIKGPKK